jgi:hypothetical protein
MVWTLRHRLDHLTCTDSDYWSAATVVEVRRETAAARISQFNNTTPEVKEWTKGSTNG